MAPSDYVRGVVGLTTYNGVGPQSFLIRASANRKSALPFGIGQAVRTHLRVVNPQSRVRVKFPASTKTT